MGQIAIVVLSSDNAKNVRKPDQLVSLRDPSVLSTVIPNVFSTDGDIFFVVLGDNSNETKQKLSLSKTTVTVLINEIGEEGLGYVVTLVISEIDKNHPEVDAVLCILVDQLFIGSVHLNTMIKLHKSQPEAIIITRKDNYLGIPVLFPRKFFPELKLLRSNDGTKQIINSYNYQSKEIIILNDADAGTTESNGIVLKTYNASFLKEINMQILSYINYL